MYRLPPEPEALLIAEDIVPIAEFKAHLSEVVRKLPGRRRPVVVTQNGKPAAVVLSPAEFDRLSRHSRFVSAVEEGLADVEQGRVVSHEDVGKLLDERFGALGTISPARPAPKPPAKRKRARQ